MPRSAVLIGYPEASPKAAPAMPTKSRVSLTVWPADSLARTFLQQLIPRNLLRDEVVIRLVGVETANDIVTVSPRMRTGGEIDSVRDIIPTASCTSDERHLTYCG